MRNRKDKWTPETLRRIGRNVDFLLSEELEPTPKGRKEAHKCLRPMADAYRMPVRALVEIRDEWKAGAYD